LFQTGLILRMAGVGGLQLSGFLSRAKQPYRVISPYHPESHPITLLSPCISITYLHPHPPLTHPSVPIPYHATDSTTSHPLTPYRQHSSPFLTPHNLSHICPFLSFFIFSYDNCFFMTNDREVTRKSPYPAPHLLTPDS